MYNFQVTQYHKELNNQSDVIVSDLLRLYLLDSVIRFMIFVRNDSHF